MLARTEIACWLTREVVVASKIEGTVTEISATGDLVTSLTAECLRDVPTDQTTAIRCDGHETLGIFPADHNEPAATLLAYWNKGNQLTLCIVEENINLMLGIGVGTKVVVAWPVSK